MSYKAHFGADIRRFFLAPNTFAGLQERLISLFHLREPHITWRDVDGDVVTIACEEDLAAACAAAGGSGQTLRIFVSDWEPTAAAGREEGRDLLLSLSDVVVVSDEALVSPSSTGQGGRGTERVRAPPPSTRSLASPASGAGLGAQSPLDDVFGPAGELVVGASARAAEAAVIADPQEANPPPATPATPISPRHVGPGRAVLPELPTIAEHAAAVMVARHEGEASPHPAPQPSPSPAVQVPQRLGGRAGAEVFVLPPLAEDDAGHEEGVGGQQANGLAVDGGVIGGTVDGAGAPAPNTPAASPSPAPAPAPDVVDPAPTTRLTPAPAPAATAAPAAVDARAGRRAGRREERREPVSPLEATMQTIAAMARSFRDEIERVIQAVAPAHIVTPPTATPAPAPAPARATRAEGEDDESHGAAADAIAGAGAGSEPEPVHAGVVCDGCSGAIVGRRFKCCVCPDFDLCMRCEATGAHGEHPMVRLCRPAPARGLWQTRCARWVRRFMPPAAAARPASVGGEGDGEVVGRGVPVSAPATPLPAGTGPSTLPAAAPARPSPETQRMAGRWAAEMSTLRAMGFALDDETLAAVLRDSNGVVAAAVERLLA